MKKIEIRPNGTTRVVTLNDEPSLTDQQWAKDCDVNHILAQFTKTGRSIPPLTGQYADLSTAPEYMEALNTIINAESAFNSLPARTRARFDNDPAQLLSFLEDPSNRDEAIQLNLIPKNSQPTNNSQTTNANGTMTNNAINAKNDNAINATEQMS